MKITKKVVSSVKRRQYKIYRFFFIFHKQNPSTWYNALSNKKEKFFFR